MDLAAVGSQLDSVVLEAFSNINHSAVSISDRDVLAVNVPQHGGHSTCVTVEVWSSLSHFCPFFPHKLEPAGLGAGPS